MGSAASSNSKVVRVENGANEENRSEKPRFRSNSEPRSPRSPSPSSRPPSGGEFRRSRHSSSKVAPFSGTPKKQLEDCQKELSECQKQVKEGAERERIVVDRKGELEKQVGSLESDVLDLQEQITSLQELTEQQHQSQLVDNVGTNQECSETILAKDSYIHKLEAEMEALKVEQNKIRVRLKKKLRTAKTDLTEQKHLSSSQFLDLREEIGRLMEENSSLMSAADKSTNSPIGAMPSPNDPRTSIIVDLSSQISEQATQITELEEQLKQKETTIQDLHSESKSQRKVQRAKSMSSRSLNRSKSRDKLLDESAALVEESDITDAAPSNPLLMTAKADNSEMQELRAIARQMMKVHKRRIDGDGDDERESSGISRDSGILDEGCDSKHNNRPTSATSTLSELSANLEEDDNKHQHLDLPDWNTDSEDEFLIPKDIPADNLRQISAPKRKLKINVSEYDYVDKLMSTSVNSDTSMEFRYPGPVRGKPPNCGRVSSMRSPRSPSSSISSPAFGMSTTNKHIYTIGHV